MLIGTKTGSGMKVRQNRIFVTLYVKFRLKSHNVTIRFRAFKYYTDYTALIWA